VRRVPDRDGARDRIRLDGKDSLRGVRLEGVVDGGAPERLGARERRDPVAVDEPKLHELVDGLAVPDELTAARDRDDDLVRQLPARSEEHTSELQSLTN